MLKDNESRGITLLHISDFHFKTDKVKVFDQKVVINALIEAIDNISSGEDKWRPELVLCTGDLAFSGTGNQYVLALDFLTELAKAVSLSKWISTCTWQP